MRTKNLVFYHHIYIYLDKSTRLRADIQQAVYRPAEGTIFINDPFDVAVCKGI